MMTVSTDEASRSTARWPAEAPLGDADYTDSFIALTSKASSHTPKDWSRYVLEGASVPMRIFLRVGWRYGLGFRLTRHNSVLGWPVRAEAADWIILQQRSWLFSVALLMRATENQLTWSTRVKFTAPLSRVAWMVVGVLHRRFAPRALRRAVDRATP